MSNLDKEYVEERVAFVLDPEQADAYLPRISVIKSVDRVGRAKVEKNFRAFQTDDIGRVLDFDSVPDPPPDGPLMHGEGPLNDMKFPKRHMCLRGGFLFIFDLSNVSGTGQSHFVHYHGPPIGVIPLDKVQIEFPPGGRRVFREHAQSDARTGYELAILHASKDETARPPAFIAADSLAQRDRWASAIKARAAIEAHTSLRAQVFGQDDTFATKPAEILKEKEGKKKDKEKDGKREMRRKGRRGAKKDDKDDDGENNLIGDALQEFGKNNFTEKAWIDNYFETHNDANAETKGRELEQWQEAIKRGLKNAVLEQYEYFVEASGEMTTMGKEVVDLKTLVETQVETIKEMKEIDFVSDIREPADGQSDGEEEVFEKRRGQPRRRSSGDDDSDVSSVSSYGEGERDGGDGAEMKYRDPDARDGAIEIPAFLEDAAEEIQAFAKESRYSDATELWAKAKEEVMDIIKQHEQPTENYLTKKQYNQMNTLVESLDDLSEMISKRLVENLRRKNEALKQASKRERSDPMAGMVPSVSPTCLSDDSLPLKLLVKLGKTQEAAIAYSARRSLLLMESLHERPLSGTGNVDLVIYAAQLSQSFFSCLAGAIEGFLDIFLASANDRSSFRTDESSIHTDGFRDLPAGALASIVLWCDSELAKFSAAFGGTRILGNLALTPPPRDGGTPAKGPRVVGEGDTNGTSTSNLNRMKDRQAAIEVAAQCVSQAFQYASENLDSVGLPLTPRLAESLRKRLKGCEAEVSRELSEEWRPIVMEWEWAMDDEDGNLEERRGL
eukprot:Nitzschia sp. Nitz4//scaffold178_size73299//66749//69252//NITZ4_005721-RA/size73299-snap-gene-0.136-mRNA-1//1//CDS//3329539188//5096//frame0